MSTVRSLSEKPHRSIAIVGAGFTGTMLAVRLIELTDAPLRIFLFDRESAFGNGAAYSTSNARHLLNVRVENMSAYEADPGHFVRWLGARKEGRGAGDASDRSRQTFVSRALYGDYLCETFEAARREAASRASVVEVNAEVADLRVEGERIELTAANGARYEVDGAVLCLGNFPPALRFDAGFSPRDARRYVSNPWSTETYDRIGPDDSVVILGTGLSMVDVVQELRSRNHRGAITAVSRRGLLPVSHRATAPYPSFLDANRLPSTARKAVRVVRREIARAAQRGLDWRSVIDALRPQTQSLWRTLPHEERRRFLRHVRPYWEVHRHRLAPAVAEEVSALLRSGQLTVVTGRVTGIDAGDDAFVLDLRLKGTDDLFTLSGAWLINCSGPQLAYDQIRDPLIRSLLERGVARPDPLRLGFDVTDDYRLIGETGAVAPSLFTIGPPIRGKLWETTAVPDIRKQCEALARHIVGKER
jgi:uncharacterized NAD(P)/FAD-binding protein YdhS